MDSDPGSHVTLGLAAWASGLAAAASAPPAEFVLVAGNEASDADSIVSALAYAYLRDASGERAMPIVACNRADIALRGETVILLQLCGVDATHLLFLDDAFAQGLLADAREVVLVDHNKAFGPLAAIGEKVTMILDHHRDSGDHAHVVGPARRIAFEGSHATAGSCCTLIAEAFLETATGKSLLARENGAAARALLGVILIDTVGLEPKFQKVTPRDTAMAELLESLAPEPARAELFAKLDAAKFDEAFWSSLEPGQCLRYDYKRFEAGGKVFGLSSVLCSLERLAGKQGWAEEAARWTAEVDLFGVLSNTKHPGGVQRQVVLLSADGGALASQAAEFASGYTQPDLQLRPMELPGVGPPGARAFEQGNSAASRKQVAPCLGAFFESLGAGAAL